MRIEFLFDPESVRRELKELPLLRSALAGNDVTDSASIRNVQKCPREIYRVLGGTHYPHLAELLRTLELCLQHGFTQPTLLQTRARKPFFDALAELHAAEHFLLNGFSIVIPQENKAGPKPEFIASGHGVEIAVEVYSPRIWEGLSGLSDGLIGMLMNWDAPFSYKARLRLEGKHFKPSKLLLPHPGELSDALTGPVCEALAHDFNRAIAEKLGKSTADFTVERERPDLNLAISLSLSSIDRASDGIPARSCVTHGPTKTGHAPEGIFDRLIARNVTNKARQRQAIGHAPLSLLLVDLTQTDLRSELDHPFYRGKFSESIRAQFSSGLQGYDAIAFYEALGWQRKLRSHFLVREDERVSDEVSRTFFESPVETGAGLPLAE